MILANTFSRQFPRKQTHFESQHQALLSRQRPLNLELDVLRRETRVANRHRQMLSRTERLAWAKRVRPISGLTAGNRAQYDKRLLPRHDRFGQDSIWRFVRKVLFACEEAEERTALQRDVVANGSAQHGILGLERVEDRALRHGCPHLKRQFCTDMGQGS